MKANPRASRSFKSGMLVSEAIVVTSCISSVVAGVFIGSLEWKHGSDRDQTIMNIRNCQQAMRGEQNMKQLKAGDPFARKDLEQFMKFPENFKVPDGVIRFGPGDEKIKPESANPAVNNEHLWLQVEAPNTRNHVGKYGFDAIADVTGW